MRPSTDIAISADGTPIPFHTLGTGPGLVIVHGAMQSGMSQLELAELLAPTHTVHLVDRRGRGTAPATSTAQEVADLLAVVSATGARDVFGVSSGAIIAARAALASTSIRRLALFEPPFSVSGSVRIDLLPSFSAAIAANDLPRAMALAMRVAEMGPPWMFCLPTPLLAAVSRRMLEADDRKQLSDGAMHLRELAHALPGDFAVVAENADTIADFGAIDIPTLLVDGTRTRPYLRGSIAALRAAIPGAEHVELAGQRHSATQNRDQWGRPDLVAPVLQEFLAPRA